MQSLRDEGLLEFTKGCGITLTVNPEKRAVLLQVRELIEFANHQGYRRDEVIEMIATLR